MFYLIILLIIIPLLLCIWRMPGFLNSLLPLGKNREEKVKRFLLIVCIGDLFATVMWISNGEGRTVFLLSLAAAGATWFLHDYDLHKKEEEKRELLETEYPAIVSKLTLYLGAGMNLFHAFQKTAKEGLQKKDANPVYKEMQITCGEIAHGISQPEAYIGLGKRIGSQRYIRLGTLLAQNLKKGNAELLVQLKAEAMLAMEEHTAKLRKKGEEMGTKLLLPMMLMMGIAMMLIIVPVFLSL